jgi:hypothetical protein
MNPIATASFVVALAGAGLAHAATPEAVHTHIAGMWIQDNTSNGHPTLPLTPLGQAAEAKEMANIAAGHVISDDERRCDPVGMPGFMTNEFALQILETPDRVVMVSEMSPLTRQIYLDKPQTGGTNGPMWNGHSVGKWEGDTLVIDTVNFQAPDNPIVFGGLRSANLHLTERYHLENNGNELVGDMTFVDPKLLTKPYVTHLAFKRLPDDAELWEYACLVGDAAWAQRFPGDKGGAQPSAPVK